MTSKLITTDDLDMAQIVQWLNDNQLPDAATFVLPGSAGYASAGIANGQVTMTWPGGSFGTAVTVKHGLGAVPDIILLTPTQTSGAYNVCPNITPGSVTAVQFQIMSTCIQPGGATPPAGNTSLIYWLAKL